MSNHQYNHPFYQFFKTRRITTREVWYRLGQIYAQSTIAQFLLGYRPMPYHLERRFVALMNEIRQQEKEGGEHDNR